MLDYPLLTKESEYLLGLIYKRYLELRESGSSREDARRLGSSSFISEQIMPETTPDDITDLMRELENAEVVSFLSTIATFIPQLLPNLPQ